MFSQDPELLRLQVLAMEAYERFSRLAGFQNSEVLEHAREIWLEARTAYQRYAQCHAPQASAVKH